MIADLGVDRPWRRFFSFLALALVLSIAAIMIMTIALRFVPEIGEAVTYDGVLSDTVDRLIGEGQLALGLGVALGTTAFALLLAAAITYRQRLDAFLWPGRRPSLRQFLVGFGVLSAASVALIPFYLLTGSTWDPPLFDPDYLPTTRAPYVVMTLTGLLIAAAAEEVACRGVLLRLTGQVTRNAAVLCLINGVLFSALHVDPDPVAFVARTLSGAVWTWAALRLGGLEFATGAHLANNVVLSLFSSPLSESALYSQGQWIDLVPELIVAGVTLAAVERLAGDSRDPSTLVSAPG